MIPTYHFTRVRVCQGTNIGIRTRTPPYPSQIPSRVCIPLAFTKGDEGDSENREEEDSGKEGHRGDGENVHYGPHFRWITLRYLVKSLSYPLFRWIPGESGWNKFPMVILDEWILIHFTWYSDKNHQSPHIVGFVIGAARTFSSCALRGWVSIVVVAETFLLPKVTGEGSGVGGEEEA